jgi:hypothetical protein
MKDEASATIAEFLPDGKGGDRQGVQRSLPWPNAD